MDTHITRTKLDAFLKRFGREPEPLKPVLSAAQILYRLAEMEEEAVGYYEGLAQYSDLPWVRSFASKIANAEKDHQKYFFERAQALEAGNAEEGTEGPLPPDLLQLMSSSITPQRSSAEKTAVYFGEKDCIDFAIQAEANAIQLLTQLNNYVPVEQHEIINRVLRDEMQHKSSLEELSSKHFKE
jgi:rubrerythrin